MMRRLESEVRGFSFGIIFGCAALVAFVGGCSSLMPLGELLLDNADCAVKNQNLPNEEILKRCAVRPENFKRILDLVGTAREESALQANRAAAVQAEKDQRAGVCK